MLRLLGAIVPVPYPSWLNTGDNTWQITCRHVRRPDEPPRSGHALRGHRPKKWAVNVLAMMFAGFSLVLIAWVLWTYKMGSERHRSATGVTKTGYLPRPVASGLGQALLRQLRRATRPDPEQGQNELGQAKSAANTVYPVPLPDRLARLLPVRVRCDHAASVPRQRSRADQVQCLVHARRHSGRHSSTAIDAFLLWGGGYFAQEGALDFSGGFVIHMSAGVSGLSRPGVSGPGSSGTEDHFVPNNLVMAAVGAGILWLGWNRSTVETRITGRRAWRPRSSTPTWRLPAVSSPGWPWTPGSRRRRNRPSWAV